MKTKKLTAGFSLAVAVFSILVALLISFMVLPQNANAEESSAVGEDKIPINNLPTWKHSHPSTPRDANGDPYTNYDFDSRIPLNAPNTWYLPNWGTIGCNPDYWPNENTFRFNIYGQCGGNNITGCDQENTIYFYYNTETHTMQVICWMGGLIQYPHSYNGFTTWNDCSGKIWEENILKADKMSGVPVPGIDKEHFQIEEQIQHLVLDNRINFVSHDTFRDFYYLEDIKFLDPVKSVNDVMWFNGNYQEWRYDAFEDVGKRTPMGCYVEPMNTRPHTEAKEFFHIKINQLYGCYTGPLSPIILHDESNGKNDTFDCGIIHWYTNGKLEIYNDN